jgi:hypothetical protein
MDLGQLQKMLRAPELIGILAFAAGLKDTPDPISAPELAADFSLKNLKKDNICLEISRFM